MRESTALVSKTFSLTWKFSLFARITCSLSVLPSQAPKQRATVVYFPGSTIGNFEPTEAAGFFAAVANALPAKRRTAHWSRFKKGPAVLERAYNDSAGVTAQFNLNLLARINRELGADFDLDDGGTAPFIIPMRAASKCI